MTDPATIEAHAAQIVAAFIGKEMHAECSCGWVGEIVPGLPDDSFRQFHPHDRARWKREAREQQRHLAMADWAAHVHVAVGLATADPAGA